MTQEQPIVLIIAGPNGSGTTTLTKSLVSRGTSIGEYINPDDIAAGLTGSYDARVLEAQRQADERRAAAVRAGRSFSFETVMSHPSKLDLLRSAKQAGFLVRLFFVATDNPSLNVERVKQRVSEGGHDVPEERILARYERTLSLLQAAFDLADEAAVFDNSRARLHVTTADGLPKLRLVIRKQRQIVTLRLPLPPWIEAHLRFGGDRS